MLDLHTHTQASDGELAAEALFTCYDASGIELGISDHLFRGALKNDAGIDMYLTMLEGLPVYRGCEIDIGCVRTLPDRLDKRFQYRILSVHSVELPDGNIYSLEPYFADRAEHVGTYQAPFHQDMAKTVLERLLSTYELDMLRHKIEILGHCTATPFHEMLNGDSFLDEWENALLALCEAYHAALEINELWKSPGSRMVRKAVERGIKLSCGSDCHHARHAAKLKYVASVVQQVGLTEKDLYRP